MQEIPSWGFYLFVSLIGATIGSFANVCIHRMPKHMSVAFPGSHCPLCSHRIAWWENIPIISYIILGGRCRGCKKRISIRYPIVELLGILLAIVTWWHFQNMGQFLAYYFLFCAPLLILSVIDLYHKIIPDIISIPGIFVGIGVREVFAHPALRLDVLIDSALGIIVGGGFLFVVGYLYEKIKKREGLGGGDVKLAAMIGSFLGWQQVIFVLLFASVLGLVAGVVMLLCFKKDRYFEIPFGPFLSAAALTILFCKNIIVWYTSLF